jgi:hypothetical protein
MGIEEVFREREIRLQRMGEENSSGKKVGLVFEVY